jgi:CRISPR/Cas system-associated protein Cas5 (RAMP superfamily)
MSVEMMEREIPHLNVEDATKLLYRIIVTFPTLMNSSSSKPSILANLDKYRNRLNVEDYDQELKVAREEKYATIA